MTAWHSCAVLTILTASALSGCAIASPQYPIRESEASTPAIAGVASAATATAPAATNKVVSVDAASQSDDAPMATSSSGAAVQSATLPPAYQNPPVNAAASEPAPITEAPSGAGVFPPVNRRPGALAASPPPPPAAVSLRASRGRTAPPAPISSRPLVAGRVESVNDLSHLVDVEKGDTVNSIADGLMTPRDSLIKANRLRKPYDLEVGQSLKVPVHKVYVVQSGDTLYGIARRFSTPVDVLSDINRIQEKSRLRTGQRIALPDGARDIGPMARPVDSAAEVARAEPTPAPSPRVPRAEDPRAQFPRAETPRTAVARTETAPPPSLPAASSAPAAEYKFNAPPPDQNPFMARQNTYKFNAPPPDQNPFMAPQRSNRYAGSSSPRPYSTLRPQPPSRPFYPPVSAAPDAAAPVPDSQIQIAGRGRFIWPVRGNLLSGFGPKPGGQRNDGVDIGAPEHSAVKAAAAGDVVYAGDQIPGFGNLVLIKHEGGWVTAYAHLSASEVKIREHVSQGDEIGQVGQTGGVDQPQLHFEIRYAPSTHDKARPIDPSLVLSGSAED
jgi:murein DD-endopeptidase MepM/ murein hydrolase activator NlpD